MNSRAKQNHKLIIPHLQFQTNLAEINALKQKVLANHYDRQILSKEISESKQTTSTTRRSSQNPQSQLYQMPSYFQINSMQLEYERNMRKRLAKEYQQQMERKQSHQKLQKLREREQEKKMIDNINQATVMLEQKRKKANQQYRHQLDEQLQRVKKNKQLEMERKSLQKQLLTEKYGTLQRSHSMNQNYKMTKFKEYYDNFNQLQSEREKNYLNKWSPLIKEKEYEKEKIIGQGIFKSNKNINEILEKQREKQFKDRYNLRQILQDQIKQKQLQKKQRKYLNRYQHSRSNSSTQIHNPITNPIDFKMAHDNRLILKELQQEQIYSGLARNGSQSLLTNQYSSP